MAAHLGRASQPRASHKLFESSIVLQPPVQLAAFSETFAVGHWDDVVLTLWRTRVTVEQLEVAQEVVLEVGARHARGIATLTIMDKSVMLSVPADVRRKAKAVVDAGDRYVLARALVLAGDGFWASALRSVLIGIGYVQRQHTQIVLNLEHAARHLATALRRPKDWELRLLAAVAAFDELSRRPPIDRAHGE